MRHCYVPSCLQSRFFVLVPARYRPLVIGALRYSKYAKQCIHSTLFTLLIYDFLQYETQVWVAASDGILLELYADWFSVSPDESSETEYLNTDVATTSSGTVHVLMLNHSQ
jgi:hypothetical protein